MQRTIYHGSSQIVRSPGFGSGTAGNDFGVGFYCTESLDLAREWAVSRNRNGFANRYLIETDGLRIVNLNSPEYCILHWLAILLNFREFDAGSSEVYRAKDYIRTAFNADFQNCDCIIGFRADNSNFLIAQSFLDGKISYRQFNDAVRLNDTGRQFVLKSNRAFDRVIFDGYSVVWSTDSFPASVTRDRRSMEMYAAMTGSGKLKDPDRSKYIEHDATQRSQIKERKKDNTLYISTIVEEGIGPYDNRLTRI